MPIRKIYTDGITELQVFWDENGIHLELNQQDWDVPQSILLDSFEGFQLAEDIELYSLALEDENKSNS